MSGKKTLREDTWSWRSKKTLAEFNFTKYLISHGKKKSTPSYLEKNEWLCGLMAGARGSVLTHIRQGKMNQT